MEPIQLQSSNHHLHLFRFFHESEEPLHVENNLTRALALCLQHDATFLYSLLQDWLSPEDFAYLLANPPGEAQVMIDIQVETGSLVDLARKVYAIGVTSFEGERDWTKLTEGISREKETNVADLVVAIKDILLIIEVKRTDEDCCWQLAQQVLPLCESPKQCPVVSGLHYPWSKVVDLIRRQQHFAALTKSPNPFTTSFFQLIQYRFNHWIPTLPFSQLAFDTHHSNSFEFRKLQKRLLKSLTSIGQGSLMHFVDRVAIKMNKGWASEAIPGFENRNGNPVLTINVWPGNIKAQGWSLYSLPPDWKKKTTIDVQGETFEVEVLRHIKFMHFNRYVTHIDIPMSDTTQLINEINTVENFREYSGRWDRGQWQELDQFLNDHIKGEWKAKCAWNQSFEATDRTYLTLSLGFQIKLYVPYGRLQSLDHSHSTFRNVGAFFQHCIDALKDRVEGRI